MARMVSLGLKAGYLEARTLAAERGMKLPSNVLHDDILIKSRRWDGLWDLYPAWAREIAVYPQKNDYFAKGFDVVDSEIGWVFPASHIPAAAIGVRSIGLLVDPEDLREERGRVIVHPRGEVKVLTRFIQENGKAGRLDRATRMPLDLEPRTESETRRLYRLDCAGVRPVARFIGSEEDDYWRRGVYCLYGPASRFGVAGELPKPSEKGK